MLATVPMQEKLSADFCLEIDYQKGSANPSRVFRAMTELIETVQQIDLALIGSIDNKIQPVLLLEDIESGSVRAWLRNVLEKIDDGAIKDMDWKKQVGAYLVKGKYVLIDFLKNKTEITDKKQLYELQGKLLKLAEETEVRNFPAYSQITTQKLIQGIDLLNKSLAHLDKKDSVKYISDEGETKFNLDFNFVPEQIEDLLTKEKLESTSEMILKVKKPDYLGDSRWELKHDKVILAKILHKEWLEDFQNRKIDIRPGDSLKAKVRIVVKYGFDNEVIGMNHEILEVIKVMNNDENTQAVISF